VDISEVRRSAESRIIIINLADANLDYRVDALDITVVARHPFRWGYGWHTLRGAIRNSWV